MMVAKKNREFFKLRVFRDRFMWHRTFCGVN
jgi:hypothetical protein